MSKPDVITLGESMIVFNPVMDVSFIESPFFIKQIAGAESNFAIGLSRLGHKVGWISRLSNDSFGNYINNVIRGNGVDTSMVQFDDDNPAGLLIKERTIKARTNVHYYRDNSSAKAMDPSILDERYFDKAKYLFITGITPILSETCEKTIFKAIHIAKERNIKIIFDPNIRFKLIKDKIKYKNKLNELASLSDFFLPGINEAIFLCGREKPEEIAEHYLKLNQDLNIVIKLGAEGCFYANSAEYDYIPGFKVDDIVDPIGAGDGFAAGLTSGLLEGKGMKESLERANLIGSMLIQTIGDVEGFPFKQQLDDYQQYVSKPSIDEVTR